VGNETIGVGDGVTEVVADAAGESVETTVDGLFEDEASSQATSSSSAEIRQRSELLNTMRTR
jgi:hypothetical protein